MVNIRLALLLACLTVTFVITTGDGAKDIDQENMLRRLLKVENQTNKKNVEIVPTTETSEDGSPIVSSDTVDPSDHGPIENAAVEPPPVPTFIADTLERLADPTFATSPIDNPDEHTIVIASDELELPAHPQFFGAGMKESPDPRAAPVDPVPIDANEEVADPRAADANVQAQIDRESIEFIHTLLEMITSDNYEDLKTQVQNETPKDTRPLTHTTRVPTIQHATHTNAHRSTAEDPADVLKRRTSVHNSIYSPYHKRHYMTPLYLLRPLLTGDDSTNQLNPEVEQIHNGDQAPPKHTTNHEISPGSDIDQPANLPPSDVTRVFQSKEKRDHWLDIRRRLSKRLYMSASANKPQHENDLHALTPRK